MRRTSRRWRKTVSTAGAVEGNVLIEDGRIVSVERGKGTKRPTGATAVSGKGQFLIPGLIDSHVHLAAIPGVQFQVSFGPNAAKAGMINDYLNQLPRSYLYFGYTTLVDLAAVNRGVLDEFRQATLHPDLYDCGQSLPIANGYPMSFAPPATRFQVFPNFLYDPKQASSIPAEYKPQDHTPAAAVARVKNSDGICVKTYFERGFGRERNLPVISADTLAEVRKDATQAGLVLMMQYLTMQAIPKVIPTEMLEWFNSPQGKWFKREISDDDTPDAAMLGRFDDGALRRVRLVAGYLASRDANFLFGTDTPSAPTYGDLPGLNGYLEMQQLKKAGLSFEQIFRAATINNARKFKIDSQVGTIEPGKIANLVLLKN